MWLNAKAESKEIDGTVLLTELRPALIAYFRRRCGDTAEAEDLAQDVILRALTSRPMDNSGGGQKLHIQDSRQPLAGPGATQLTHGNEVEWNEERVQAVAEEIRSSAYYQVRKKIGEP